MKKLIFLLFMISATCQAATYYVSNDGNDLSDGLSDANAWETLEKIKITVFSPDDFIKLKRGSLWGPDYPGTGTGELFLQQTGTSGHPITVTDYDTGDKPVLNARAKLTDWDDDSANWTETSGGSNIWWRANTVNVQRCWIDEQEYQRAETGLDVTSSSRWCFESSNSKYFVYSVGNPVSVLTTIKYQGVFGTITLRGDYIHMSNLDIKAGFNSVWWNATGGTGCIIEDCDLGFNALRGVSLGIDGAGAIGTVIRNNNFDSNWDAGSYTQASACPISEGVLLSGASNCKIYGNLIKDFHHAGVYLSSSSVDRLVNNNEVYNNEIFAENISYSRGLGADAANADHCSGNKFHNNYLHDLSIRSQINGNDNEVYYNVFEDFVWNRVSTGWGTTLSAQSQGIAFEDYTGICYGNKIYNNVFVNLPEAGISLISYGTADVTGHEIKNNIFYNCGIDSFYSKDAPSAYDGVGLVVSDHANIHTNTFNNNSYYSPSYTDTIAYRGVFQTVTEFEGSLSNSDVATNNIATDPLFRSATDYQLQYNSPAINAGVDVGLTSDFLGSLIVGLPDIGAYEYTLRNSIFGPKKSILGPVKSIYGTKKSILGPVKSILGN